MRVTMKILVLQLKRIGDLVLTTPALATLRSFLPAAEITLLIEHGSRELLPAIDFVDESLVFHRGGSNLALWRRLALTSFDVCLDFSGTDRSAFFSILSKARIRATFASTRSSRLRGICYNQFVASSVRDQHTIDHYLRLLRALDIVRENVPITLHLPDWSEKKARQILEHAALSPNQFAIIHPGTARPEKFWLPERWAEIAEHLEKTVNLKPVLVAGSAPIEREHLEKIQKLHACIDLSGRVDLLTFTALARNAGLVLTVDSAPMHLAAAAGAPQIALFGMTNPFHWWPRHERSAVVVAGQREPNPPLVPSRPRKPMSEISTQQVIDAIETVLDVPRIQRSR
jgi:ADP-heptose:LPS heptosyltransferase